MSKITPLEPAILTKLAQALDFMSGSEITARMHEVDLCDPSGPNSTKWRRMDAAFAMQQARDGGANRVLAFAKTALAPARFAGEAEQHASCRAAVNAVLAFAGFTIREDGTMGPVAPARTVSEAAGRAGRLRTELTRRRVHADVLKHCRAELLDENYFHAVLEATKSVAVKIRAKTGLTADGADLVTQALALGQHGTPLLAFNSLQTETEKSEQKGLVNVLIGMFGAFRNVTAHGAKIEWAIDEQDALDLLTLTSLLHRRLDAAVRTR